MTLSGSHGGVGDLDRWFGQRGGDRQPLGCTVKFFGIVNVGRRRWDHIGMLGAEERRIVRREAESGLHGQRERERSTNLIFASLLVFVKWVLRVFPWRVCNRKD